MVSQILLLQAQRFLVYVLTLNIGASVLRFGIDKNEKPTRVFMYGAKIDIIACIVLSGGNFFWPICCVCLIGRILLHFSVACFCGRNFLRR